MHFNCSIEVASLFPMSIAWLLLKRLGWNQLFFSPWDAKEKRCTSMYTFFCAASISHSIFLALAAPKSSILYCCSTTTVDKVEARKKSDAKQDFKHKKEAFVNISNKSPRGLLKKLSRLLCRLPSYRPHRLIWHSPLQQVRESHDVPDEGNRIGAGTLSLRLACHSRWTWRKRADNWPVLWNGKIPVQHHW